VSGRSLVPWPPAITTAFIACMIAGAARDTLRELRYLLRSALRSSMAYPAVAT
jgi:hypothetical protein